MLQIAKIKENSEGIAQRLDLRGINGKERVAKILSIDEKRRAVQHKKEELLAQMNQLSAAIGDLFKAGKRERSRFKEGGNCCN